MKQTLPKGTFSFFFRYQFCPALFLVFFPMTSLIVWYTNVSLDGSITALFREFWNNGFFSTLSTIWAPYFLGSAVAWKMILTYASVQLLFMKVLPGKKALGPITPKGNVPVYKANGPLAFFLTLALFSVCSFGLHLFSPTIIYDRFPELIGTLNLYSLLFCLFLYLKGRFAPSSSDSGFTGNFFFDYYWGTELYPRIAGWDVKMFTNCRFGMMGWALIILSFAAKQHQLSGITDGMIVCVALQLLYIAKFFFWEMGYMRSLDIMHDRAGFYICWGCLVWIASFYTSPTLYLVHHPHTLGLFLSSLIFLLGAGSIGINYLADLQRQKVRAAKGECLVWGRKPQMTIANYTTTSGEAKQNVLLASGWWGVARHFHYLPEISGAFFWTLPALFNHFLAYAYVSFLFLLLLDRAFRDDKRCLAKYGKDWEKHCEKVPYKIIPYVL